MAKLIHVDNTRVVRTHRSDGAVHLTVPIKIRMRGGHKEIVLPSSPSEAESGAQTECEALTTALVRAHSWNAQLERGRFRSIPELATALKLERSYVSRILELVNLAPDIALVVLDGNEPDGLTLKKLRQGIPVLWEEQRRKFGIPRS